MKHNLVLNRKELSILHRAIKVYHIDLIENDIYNELDHKLALKTVKARSIVKMNGNGDKM